MPPIATILRYAPWAIAALCLAYGLIERGNASHYEAKLERYKADAAAAVVQQQNADQKESARLLGEQKATLDALTATTSAILKSTSNAPVTNTCGPVVRDTARRVRDAIGGAGQ